MYASTIIKRRQLWDHVLAALDLRLPAVFAGDFNCITKPEEEGGPEFMWCSNQGGCARLRERLDRELANEVWIDLFLESSIMHLPRIGSDHCPLLLSTSSEQEYGSCLFFSIQRLLVRA